MNILLWFYFANKDNVLNISLQYLTSPSDNALYILGLFSFEVSVIKPGKYTETMQAVASAALVLVLALFKTFPHTLNLF